MKTCIYCGCDKDEGEFSLEHIWPDALGGDLLDTFWKTGDVCQKCNSLSGVFVDGAFIKSWMGSAEQSHGAREYLSLEHPDKGALPLHYMGKLTDIEQRQGEIVEFWLGPCGDHILHFRPEDNEALWSSYAGGDPRKKKTRAGRAYLSFTSENDFWNLVALSSFKRHFRGECYVVNAELPPEWASFKKPDPSDAIQAADLEIVRSIQEASQQGQNIRVSPVIRPDLSHRFLAKIALAVGYKAFGRRFLETDYAKDLRRGFREVDPAKRQENPVKGSGYFGNLDLCGAEESLAWPGTWVLIQLVLDRKLSLLIITPAGKSMCILVSDDTGLIGGLGTDWECGRVWLTIPSLGEAAGPISLPAYLAHQTNCKPIPALAKLADKRTDRSSLPPCR